MKKFSGLFRGKIAANRFWDISGKEISGSSEEEKIINSPKGQRLPTLIKKKI
jgi:hypothetical protein